MALTPDSAAAPPAKVLGAPRGLWLILAIIGTIYPNLYFMTHYLLYGFDFVQVTGLTVSNWIATGVTADLCTSAVIFWVWAGYELRRKGELGKLWVYIALFIGFGLCCALPVFLYRHGRRD